MLLPADVAAFHAPFPRYCGWPSKDQWRSVESKDAEKMPSSVAATRVTLWLCPCNTRYESFSVHVQSITTQTVDTIVIKCVTLWLHEYNSQPCLAVHGSSGS